jgi:hypothetical protein
MSAGRRINTLSQHWCTPPTHLAPVRALFGGRIDLDPCSNGHSVVGATVEYRLPDQDGLVLPWNYPHIYVNPPFGRDKERGTGIRDWLKRCATAGKDGSEVLALIPVATNTKHWKESVFGAAQGVCFLADTRLKFLIDGKEGGKGAPMACAMVYWGKQYLRFYMMFGPYGTVLPII